MAAILTPIDAQERAKREQALVATIAHLRIEDFHLDDELKRIFQKHVNGEIDYPDDVAHALCVPCRDTSRHRLGSAHPYPAKG
jgi:hypothetical protein